MHHYLICSKILPVQCLYETLQLSVLFANPPCTLFKCALSFSFKLKKSTIQILCWYATLKIFVYFDVLKLLLNLQESLFTSTNLSYFTKTLTYALLIFPQLNHFIWKSSICLSLWLYRPACGHSSFSSQVLNVFCYLENTYVGELA